MAEAAKRLPTPERGAFPDELDKASICYWKTESGIWLIHLPPDWLGSLARHDVQEHEDGTITVSPSIKVHQPGGHRFGQRHGFLNRGMWEPCPDDVPAPASTTPTPDTSQEEDPRG